ncbi:death domain-containing protein 1 [Caretta caretta]|uniref:death domain-containing protein 1 n=1 Tax=Caretta caretta TaxID=8467 RepID=UPI002094C5EF|nr:death domain-containing protein 1 [Caretta caretta]
MEVAECKITPGTDKSSQVLEQIWHLNLMTRETLLKGDLQDNEDTAEYMPRLIFLMQELSSSLSQQLQHNTEILQDTCQLLNTLQNKHKQLVSSQEIIALVGCLRKINELFLDTVTHLQEAKNKFYDIRCRHDDKSQSQIVQVVSNEIVVCEREKTHSGKVSAGVRQRLQVTSPMNERKSPNIHQVQSSENKTVEKETALSVSEKNSDQEQAVSRDLPKLMENEDHKLLQSSHTEQKDCNRKDESHGARPYNKKCPKRAFQEVPGSNGDDIIVSGKSEDICDRSVINLSDQEQAVSEEPPTQMEYEDHKPTENSCEEEKDDEKKEEIYEINGNNTNKAIESARSENICNTPAMNLSTNDSEEVERSSPWMNKEFLAEVSGNIEPEVACYITAPSITLENLVCRIINDMSSLVVEDSEALVSNVISVACLDQGKLIPFPINIAIPFTARYRGNYRDIMVKVTNMNFQSSYLTPISFDGYQGNQKGTFAEVKICQLGIFSVVSCLKKETFTIPKKGLSQKLSMDSRISFYYPPEMFSSPVTMQLKVQPIEPSLVSILKAKYDMYHAVVSTSPLVHIQHPSSQPFNKSVSVILPCPPNPEKKRSGDATEHGRASSATVTRVTTAYHLWAMSASVRKHGENLGESLKVLGYRSKEEEWVVLDDVIVRNARNGLVSFEVDEYLESFIVIRLSFAMDNTHLVLFMQALEEAIRSTMANVVLYQKKENPHKIVVLLVLSKELNWELQNLREEGYFGPPEPTQQFQLREGEQIHFRFSGNIFASDDGKNFGKAYRLTFHSQRKPRLELQLQEVDEFGNYSSPHYKGTAVFYKMSRETIAKKWDQPLLPDDYQDQSPLCKLALTLPKHEKSINRPQSTKRISTDSSEALWDNLLYWLAEELSEDNASLLSLHLPIRRSTLQLVRLKCPDNLTHQIYELLCFWKKNLPRSADKQRLLSRYLRKSGRSDLSEELRFKWENKAFTWQKHWFEMDN